MFKVKPFLKNNLLAIRHGHSLFNQKQDLFFQKYPNLQYYQAENHIQYKNVLYDKNLIDCQLSHKGKQQCRLTKQLLKQQQFQIILVSPLQRALQSAKIIFQGRQKNLKVQVLPQLAQTVRYSCDISDKLEQKINRFSMFDFKAMQNMSNYWYIQLLQQKQQKLFFEWKKINDENFSKPEEEKILQLLLTKDLFESDQHLKIRFERLRNQLLDYSLKYKRIAIISHYYMLQRILQKEQYVKESKEFFVENAKPYWTSIDQLFSI